MERSICACVRARAQARRAGVREPSVWKSALPSHPNSPFNLVHDHLEQRARAHANLHAMSARLDRHTLGARVAASRIRPAVFISSSSSSTSRHRLCHLCFPSSLFSADYRAVRSVESAAKIRSSFALLLESALARKRRRSSSRRIATRSVHLDVSIS